MEDIKIKYQDIANRNGSEDLFKWDNGKGISDWADKEGTLLSWSVASFMMNNKDILQFQSASFKKIFQAKSSLFLQNES